MDKLILHIGTEKTGSTSIQYAMAHDRKALAQRGILYPVLFGSENHFELAVYANEDEIVDELKLYQLRAQHCDLATFRNRLRQHLANEVAAAPSAHTMILSNEHCHSRLTRLSSVQRLRDLLQEFADDIEIVVYLRRQDKLAVSLFSTQLKLGGTAPVFPKVYPKHLPHYYDFQNLLQLYAEVFGADKITVRLFEPKMLYDGDIVSDFYAVTGIDLPVPNLPRANEALSAKQGLFLEAFNQRYPLIVDGQINAARGDIFSVIQKSGLSAAYRPARQLARDFYDLYAEGNDWVRQTYLADLERPTLFDEDFASYPDAPETLTLSQDDMFEFISAIWDQTQRLKGQINKA